MFELVLETPGEQVEAVSDALDALDALSVSVEDADAHTPAEQALFGEPGLPAPAAGWGRSRIVALFAGQALAQEAANILAAQPGFVGSRLVGIQALPEQDWVRLTQAQFAPVEITPEFWIVPTWHQPPAQARQIMRLDPGLAFGTGTHPTTQMCLRWLAKNGNPAQNAASTAKNLYLSAKNQQNGLGAVLDYGCGSGILALGAAQFGASRVDAVDIDPDAVRATQANALANQVVVKAGLPDLAQGTYHTVVANILATPLKVLAPLLCGYVAPGGTLVLAGILARQAQELQAAYAPYCALAVSDQQEEWILMTACFDLAPVF